MEPAFVFQQLFRDVLSRQVEYSYSDAGDTCTTMVPLRMHLVPLVVELAEAIPFAGEWAWAVARAANAIQPNEILFRMDWRVRGVASPRANDEPTAATVYCRFPVEPDTNTFQAAVGYARPFRWSGPDPSAVAAAMGVPGPRGIAFRASHSGRLRTALYFRSNEHAGESWTERLTALLAACQYPAELAKMIESNLKGLYPPGPVGVIGIDEGEDGVAGAIKFDPSNVPSGIALAFLARAGVSPDRIEALRRIAVGFRADSVSYAGVQYGPRGLSGWRMYFACEPGYARRPGRTAVESQRNLRPVRRLPHY
jgi:hypothetical protein